MRTYIEIEQFIVLPKKGQIVQVYTKPESFGIIQEVKNIQVERSNAKLNTIYGREVVLIKRTKKRYKVEDCDYCLEPSKVIFSK